MNGPILRPLSFALLLATALPAQRFATLSQSKAIRDVYAPVVAKANRSTVEVVVADVPTLLGTVVGEGLVLTKYSELRRAVRERGADSALAIVQRDDEWACALVAFDRPSDLALLRAPGCALPAIEWQERVPRPGAFLATPDTNRRPLGVGVLAAASYRHTRQRAFLGIRFADPRGAAVELGEVVAHGAAEAAGLQKGDVIVAFADHEVAGPEDLREYLARSKPGDEVAVLVRRGDRELKFDVTLGTDSSPMPSDQERIWGPLSEVRSGFRDVLQHDTVMEPGDCGGPLVDLDGRAVGVNIARAGRVETLALPAAEVKVILARLREAAGGGGK